VKKLLRTFVIESFSLNLVSGIASGLVFQHGLETLIYAGIALTLTTFIIKPIINLLLLPINLITFGLFRWVSSAITLYLATLIVTDFKIEKFFFAGAPTPFLNLPVLEFTGVGAIIAFSFLLSFITGFIYWIIS
jgi:putative membrane protein